MSKKKNNKKYSNHNNLASYDKYLIEEKIELNSIIW